MAVWGQHEGMGWWFVFGGVGMFMFWSVIIGLAIWGIRRFTQDDRRHDESEPTPVEIAKRRLANGELTNDEYEQLRKALLQ